MNYFSEEARSLIQAILGWTHYDIVGACVIYLVPAERFFKLSKTVPGVIWFGIFWCNTPEIKMFDSLFFGIDYRGSE